MSEWTDGARASGSAIAVVKIDTFPGMFFFEYIDYQGVNLTRNVFPRIIELPLVRFVFTIMLMAFFWIFDGARYRRRENAMFALCKWEKSVIDVHMRTSKLPNTYGLS